jgi:ABC-type dipeptide/oligopeptide/nickel transport system permease component
MASDLAASLPLAARRSFKWNSSLVLGGAIVLIMVLAAIFAPLLTPYDPIKLDVRARFQSPSATHWFGTDQYGRDVFTRVIYGARYDLLIAVLAVAFAAGVGTPLGMLAGDLGAFRSALAQMMAPAITVAMGLVAVVIRMLRAGMLEELGKDYVRTGRSKGLSPRAVYYKHALRNAIIPTITVVSIQIGYLLGGNVLVEAVFAWPGVGLYYINAINALDYNAVIGATLLIAVVFALINLFVDVLNAFIDPRIHYA